MMDDIDIGERGNTAKALLRVFGVVCILAVLSALVLYFLDFGKQPVKRDHEGCIVFHPDGKGVSRRTAILIDATTRIEPEMAKAILPQLSIFISNDQKSKAEERFALFSVSDKDYHLAREEAAVCRPSKKRGLRKSPLEIKQEWGAFFDELEKSFHILSTTPESDFSPIMETIDAVTEDRGNGEHFDRILIFSDMMAHMPSESFTHYASEYDAPDEPHPYLDKTGGNLHGMEVIVCYIVRPDKYPEAARQGREHRDWWRRYFDAKGAKQPILIGEIYKTKSGKYNAKCL